MRPCSNLKPSKPAKNRKFSSATRRADAWGAATPPADTWGAAARPADARNNAAERPSPHGVPHPSQRVCPPSRARALTRGIVVPCVFDVLCGGGKRPC